MLKGIATGAKTVTNVAASIFAGASLLSQRTGMTVYNESDTTVYYGPSGVTTANGMPLLSGDSVSFLFKPGIEYPIYFIAAANKAVRVVETI
jgi:hypothetical protein